MQNGRINLVEHPKKEAKEFLESVLFLLGFVLLLHLVMSEMFLTSFNNVRMMEALHIAVLIYL